jgi:hypothetical protein
MELNAECSLPGGGIDLYEASSESGARANEDPEAAGKVPYFGILDYTGNLIDPAANCPCDWVTKRDE